MLLFIAHMHSCTSNVYDNNVYEVQTYASFYFSILISVATGRWHCGSTLKDELPDPRGFLQTIYLPVLQSNQSRGFDKTTNHQSQHA